VLICDTSGLLACFDTDEDDHRAVRAVIETEPGPLVVSPYVLAELDYLLATRRGVAAEAAVLTGLSGGAWELASCDRADVRRATEIVQRYHDQNIGLTDASLVVLAARYRTNRLLTLDRRHFQVVHTLAGEPFSLLPG